MIVRLTLLSIVAVAIASCGVAPSMQYRSGSSPDLIDENLAFRATYYFRTFDPCASSHQPNQPQIDTVFRFVMTGKRGAGTQMQFESGILRADQIDPYGTRIAYPGTAAEQVIARPVAPQIDPSNGASLDSRAQHNGDVTTGTPSGGCTRQAFQIWGPQGWVPFDQDERLIMAMTSTGNPLLSVLSERARRVQDYYASRGPLSASGVTIEGRVAARQAAATQASLVGSDSAPPSAIADTALAHLTSLEATLRPAE